MASNQSETIPKLLELASVLGVGVIGFGLGTYLSSYFEKNALWIVVIGIAMHGLVMYKKTKATQSQTKTAQLLYQLCWLILIALALYVLTSII